MMYDPSHNLGDKERGENQTNNKEENMTWLSERER